MFQLHYETEAAETQKIVILININAKIIHNHILYTSRGVQQDA